MPRDTVVSPIVLCPVHFFFFFLNDPATTEIYTLSLHDALPIYQREQGTGQGTRVKRYALTRAGLEKAQELTHLLADAKVTGSDRSFDYQQIVAPIVASEAFRQFAAGGSLAEIGRERFLLAAKLFADASPFMINGRLAKAQNAISRLPESSERDR